jgi:hypothetical protein
MFLLFVFLFVVLFVFFIKKYNNQIENVKKKSIKISETICNANIIESKSGNPNGNNIIDKNQEDKTKNSDITNSFKFDKIFNKKKSHRLSFAEIDDIFASIYFRNNSKGIKISSLKYILIIKPNLNKRI